MSREAVITTDDILWSVAQLLDTVQKLKEPPEVVRNLEKRLIGFYITFRTFQEILAGFPEVESYLVNCYDLCIQTYLRLTDSKSDDVDTARPRPNHESCVNLRKVLTSIKHLLSNASVDLYTIISNKSMRREEKIEVKRRYNRL
jgi:hypothetical protein